MLPDVVGDICHARNSATPFLSGVATAESRSAQKTVLKLLSQLNLVRQEAQFKYCGSHSPFPAFQPLPADQPAEQEDAGNVAGLGDSVYPLERGLGLGQREHHESLRLVH